MRELEFETVDSLLSLDQETWKLYWKKRNPDSFVVKNHRMTKEQCCNTWNSRYENKEAFSYLDKTGYYYGTLMGKKYPAHQIIWLLVKKEWPKFDIDHINGCRNDNRVCNLRNVTHAENGRNQKKRSTNSSGFTGVYFNKSIEKWVAQITFNYKTLYLGVFKHLEEACAARKEAEVKYGFHENHGRSE